jgi:hypothetical protein
MEFLPTGTTWLDLATLVIAVGAFVLAFWRYRREAKVGVRVEIGIVDPGDDGVVAVVVTNTERRTVTVDRVGLSETRDLDGGEFEHWHSVNIRTSQSGLPLGDWPLPKTLDPGGLPYGVRASVRSIKTAFHPAIPQWAFAVDTYRNIYWGRVPEDVQAAIRATKRRINGPNDDWGQPTAVEIEDDVEVEPSALYDRRG